VLESEEGRKGYLVYPTSKNHSSSQKGRKASLKGNGRRIDYMLYTEEGLYLEWKVVSFTVNKEEPQLTQQTCLDGAAAPSARVPTYIPRKTHCFGIFYIYMQVLSL